MAKLSWTEYKTIRQYYAFGDFLDMLRAYGINAGTEVDEEADWKTSSRNGHFWLTKDPA